MGQPTIGSAFAGVGGFDAGFEWAGFATRWQIENDPFCTRVLAHHWPDVRRYCDIRSVNAAELEPVDWIVGGFPCQDLSSAGTRQGLTGPRSGLFREFLRIVAARGPSGVVIENSGHAWQQWVPVLRRALWVLGYAALPLHVRASDFRAWHLRHRVYLVAHVDPSVVRLESWRERWPFRAESPLFADLDQAGSADGAGSEAWTGIDRWGSVAADLDATGGSASGPCGAAQAWGSGEPQRSLGDAHVADANQEGQLQPSWPDADEWRRTGDGGGWPVEPDLVRSLYGVSARVDGRWQTVEPITTASSRAEGKWYSDRVGALGNAVLPVIPYWIARTIRSLTDA